MIRYFNTMYFWATVGVAPPSSSPAEQVAGFMFSGLGGVRRGIIELMYGVYSRQFAVVFWLVHDSLKSSIVYVQLL